MTALSNNKKRSKVLAWLKMARLQFYPMAWVAYTLGAVYAARTQGAFHLKAYLAGYVCLFLVELCTVFVNEYFDYASDQRNRNASRYSGGSRVLVDRLLTFREVRAASIAVLLLLAVSTLLVIWWAPHVPVIGIAAILLVGLLLGIGYTAPPMKFCYRGLGEFVVGFTHSPGALLPGFFLQVGALNAPAPW